MAKPNPLLQKERDIGTFDVQKLTYMLDGDRYMTERRRYVENLALQEKEFTEGPDYYFLSRVERYEKSLRKAIHYVKCCKKYDLASPTDTYWLSKMAFPNEVSPIELHSAMFVPSLRSQGTEKQKEKWVPLAESYQIIGTYVQTELGHGTFIRGLETIATYDPKTEEFVLNSPTITSTKWWPGGLGKTCNYAIVMALLHINDKNYGMHPFVVQLRSLETHEPLPGITIGDIGPKFGYDTIDNGFVQFDHVRIPRENMLMKNAQVLKDGTYVKSTKNDKLSYGAMVFIRSLMVHDVAARGLAQACTIAIRYSAIRQQSEMKKSQPEPQILDYQTQQFKLFPLLASAYALWFTGLKMRTTYFLINYDIQQGNVAELPELHALSCGLKSFSTSLASWGVERCRLACGGHGYSQSSGLPKLYVIVSPACTYEGENTVMLLQCARYLMKAYENAKANQKLSGSVSYLNEQLSSRSNITSDFNLQSLVDAYKHRASRMIKEASERLYRLQAKGHDPDDAWNLNAVVLTKASEAHCHFYIVSTFAEVVHQTEDAALRDVLRKLCQLFAVFGIHENSADFVMDGYLDKEQMALVRQKELSLLTDIRPNAVSLVDAFDFHDEILKSVLGRYDGNVYENLYNWAKNSPLNKPEMQEVYFKHLKHLLNPAQSKL